jgi:UDPglucose 6-dehydrogenase
MTRQSNISVVGLGKLGTPLAACLASKGFNVIGVDTDPVKIEWLSSGKVPFFEPGLQEMVQSNRERLMFTQEIDGAVISSSVTFIVVATPSEPDGSFSLCHVLSACEGIGRALRAKQGFHLFVLTSTVMPGATGNAVQRALENASGKRCGLDFGLCYNPEFIALGSVIHDFLNPDFILIGESDGRSGQMLEALYGAVCENSPPVVRMNFVNAELTKISVNTFVTTKISFANMLAGICERLPQANVDVVTSALGLDSRIGRKYLKGAVGYGGPCFPRDNRALAALAHQIGTKASLAEMTDEVNRREVQRLASLIKSRMSNHGTLGVLGLAYKPHTDVAEQSQGLLLAEALASENISVVAYDPAAMANAQRALNGRVRMAGSVEACVHEADVIAIMTPWDCFKLLEPRLLYRPSRPRVLIDSWRLLDPERFAKVTEYVSLGVGPENID